MALSRPLLLTLVGAMLMAATFLAARGARTAAQPAAQAAAVVPAPAQGKAAGKPDVAKKTKDRDNGKARADKTKNGGAPAAKPKPKPATPPAAAVATVPGVPASVARALSRKQVLVLFFRQRAADDSATAAAVKGVRGTKGVAVFQAPITKLAKYRGVVSGLGIAQAPAVVVVDRSRQAQIIEGFVDPASLKQIVKDAR